MNIPHSYSGGLPSEEYSFHVSDLLLVSHTKNNFSLISCKSKIDLSDSWIYHCLDYIWGKLHYSLILISLTIQIFNPLQKDLFFAYSNTELLNRWLWEKVN